MIEVIHSFADAPTIKLVVITKRKLSKFEIKSLELLAYRVRKGTQVPKELDLTMSLDSTLRRCVRYAEFVRS